MDPSEEDEAKSCPRPGPWQHRRNVGSGYFLLASSNNAHKVREIRAILSPSFWVADLSALHEAAPSVEETGLTAEENAALKAIAISRIHGGWVIADDSGLEVDALGGAPGVYSARYAGQAATDAENNKLLLENLEGVQGKDRTARFRCVIALARQGKVVATFSGAVEGAILDGPKGTEGFGYDPLFVPQGISRNIRPASCLDEKSPQPSRQGAGTASPLGWMVAGLLILKIARISYNLLQNGILEIACLPLDTDLENAA